MGTAKPSRVILHAMWISIVTVIPVTFAESMVIGLGHIGVEWSHLPQMGVGALVLAPVWVSAMGLSGALVGLAATGADRLARRYPRWRLASGTLAGGLVGVALLALLVRQHPLSWVIGATIGMVSAGLALALAGRAVPTGPAHGSGWGAGAAVLASVTGVAATFDVLLAHPWDPSVDCATLLSVPETHVTFISRDFPPQTWCVSLDAVQRVDTSWTASAVGLLATASLVCALIAVGRWVGAGQRTPRTVVAAAVGAGVIGAGLALWWPTVQPSASQLDQARAELRNRSTAEPSIPRHVEIRAADARQDMRSLGHIAHTSAGQTVLWPREFAVTEEACPLDSGAAGVRVLATASFTATDPAQVHGRKQMAALEHANEHIADTIANAWRTSGVLASSDQVHGEWWFGGQAGQAILGAHIGFTNGIGMLHINSDCISR